MANFPLPILIFILAHFVVHLNASSSAQYSQPQQQPIRTAGCPHEKPLQKKTFLSQGFILGPGDVLDKIYLMEFPTGHIALTSFFAEVVDDQGVSVPLYDVYLHHWVTLNVYVNQSEKEDIFVSSELRENRHSSADSIIWAGNDGVCTGNSLKQLFGLGSETRHTNTTLPLPYGIVVGDPRKVPEGYEEVWIINIHAIDTRGAEDPQGCLECRCELYNVTPQGHDGRPLANYPGGLRCCTDGTHCRLKKGSLKAERKKLFLRYTVEWREMNECVVPVQTYIFDVTATKDKCQVEYNTPVCPSGFSNDCIHTQKNYPISPQSGQVIYGVAHQHYGGRGIALYGEDGREICTSLPLYGSGTTVGDENGYVVGMTTCFPEIGSIRIEDKEVLKLESNYSTRQFHTGVMGLMYLIVAFDDHISLVSDKNDIHSSSHLRYTSHSLSISQDSKSKYVANFIIGVVLGVGFGSILIYLTIKHVRSERTSTYESLVS